MQRHRCITTAQNYVREAGSFTAASSSVSGMVLWVCGSTYINSVTSHTENVHNPHQSHLKARLQLTMTYIFNPRTAAEICQSILGQVFTLYTTRTLQIRFRTKIHISITVISEVWQKNWSTGCKCWALITIIMQNGILTSSPSDFQSFTFYLELKSAKEEHLPLHTPARWWWYWAKMLFANNQ